MLTEWVLSLWLASMLLVVVGTAGWIACRAVVASPGRVGQRLGLWMAAVFFTFFGPFSAAQPAWPLAAWAAAINQQQDFKDLWLSMIAMIVFSMSNIVDNLVRNYRKISPISQFIVPIGLVVYFIGITLGIAIFGSLANRLSPAAFGSYWAIVWGVTCFGPFWEVLIVFEVGD